MLWMQSKRCAPGMGHMGHACLTNRAGIGAAGARHEGTGACAVHKHGSAWHQGPEGQEHSGHCWVHQHRNRAWALGRGATGQVRWTSRARRTVMLRMQSQRCTLGMAHVGNATRETSR
jgi:hypothetical protein